MRYIDAEEDDPVNELLEKVRHDLDSLAEGKFDRDAIIDTLIAVREHLVLQENAAEEARIERLQRAVGVLTYDEAEVVGHLMDELGGSEGQLVASQIAERIGITRSTAVNALRKLESGGVIATRSRGSQGTLIRLLGYTHTEVKDAAVQAAA